MSGYPGGGYPGGQPAGGYPGQQPGGYPGQQPGGYPGGQPAGGYPGGQPGGGYPGSAPPRPGAPGGGYPGGQPQVQPSHHQMGMGQAPGGYPGGGYQGQQYQGYGGASAPPPGGAPPGGYPGGAPPGGYGAPPRPQVDPNVQQWFNAVDQDKSGQITASELQKALVNGNWSHFSEEACRMMIDIFDKNSSGTIDVGEFQQLFDYINQWKATFQSFDKDRSGNIEQAELNQAFQQMGYRFSPTFVQNLLSKYDPRTKKLTLDNFIVASVQIKRLTDSFRTRDREMRGAATLQYEDFIGLSMGAHR